MNTFLEVLRFELWEQLRSRTFYLYLLVCFALSFCTINTMGGAFNGGAAVAEKVNSPYAVMFGLALLSAIALLVAAGIFSQSACKDFDTKTANILFSFPIHRQSFFIGRWVSAAIVSGCIMLTLGLGYAIGEMMPWLNRENFLPFNLLGYLYTGVAE